MATKKKAAKKKPAKKMDFADDIERVFKKHNFAGTMIVKAAAAHGGPCPPNKTPHEIFYQRDDGTWVTKIVCI